MKADFPRIERLPPYVFSIVNELKAAARARGEDIIDFGMGNPERPTPEHIVEKLVETVRRPDTHRYSVSRGLARLRRAICTWYAQRYQVELEPQTEAIVTMSKSYNMPGCRVGFMCGNPLLVDALARLKSYLDHGLFTPIQVAAVAALEGPQDCVETIRGTYETRRNLLCDGLNGSGWQVARPQATMFVWAKIPAPYREMGSLAFAKKLLAEARVAVSPGIGFGDYGDDHVRFALIENEHRTRQALRGVRQMLRRDGVGVANAAA